METLPLLPVFSLFISPTFFFYWRQVETKIYCFKKILQRFVESSVSRWVECRSTCPVPFYLTVLMSNRFVCWYWECLIRKETFLFPRIPCYSLIKKLGVFRWLSSTSSTSSLWWPSSRHSVARCRCCLSPLIYGFRNVDNEKILLGSYLWIVVRNTKTEQKGRR